MHSLLNPEGKNKQLLNYQIPIPADLKSRLNINLSFVLARYRIHQGEKWDHWTDECSTKGEGIPWKILGTVHPSDLNQTEEVLAVSGNLNKKQIVSLLNIGFSGNMKNSFSR